MARHNELGKAGEEAAVELLLSKGYQILHRNWKCGRKELDIVARQQDTLVFVEVKTRQSDLYGNPFEAVSEIKIRRVMLAANAYVCHFKWDNPVRFDIISVILSKDGLKLNHIENAFISPIW